MKSSPEIAVAVACSLGLGALCPIVAFADTATGRIANYHLNSSIAGRGLCVLMEPGLGGNGWACLQKTNDLYAEITATMLAANVAEKMCTVYWNSVDSDGNKVIYAVSC